MKFYYLLLFSIFTLFIFIIVFYIYTVYIPVL